MPFKALFASPAGHLSGATFLSSAHLWWWGTQRRSSQCTGRRDKRWGGERRGICKLGRKKEKTESPGGRRSESKHLDEGPTDRKPSEYERRGERHRLCDTKVINAAVQSEVLSVDCAPNEGGLLGYQKSCGTILKMPNLSCFLRQSRVPQDQSAFICRT